MFISQGMADPDGEIAAAAANKDGVIGRDLARGAGLTPRMIDYRVLTGRWDRYGKGVYVIRGSQATWRQRLQAAVTAAGGRAAASHRSAARLHRLLRLRALVEITTHRSRRYRSDSVIVHTSKRFHHIDIESLDGLAVTTPARTLIDLGAVVSSRRVEEALDAALQDGLTSLPYLRWRLSKLRGRGRRGAGVIAAILEARSDGPVPESKYERLFIRILEESSLPLPELQYEIKRNNRLIARVDAAWPDRLIVVEVDGHQWHSTRSQRAHDAARENAIKLAGWQVLRFTTDQVWEKPHEITATLKAALFS